MNEIVLYEPEKRSFQKAFDYCSKWSSEHQAEVGVAEIALGAGLIAWGLQSGHIQMGIDVVASKLSESGLSGGSIGGAAGAVIGGIGGNILGAIGVAGAGTAIAVPALAVIGGGAAILSVFGYTVGDVAGNVFAPPGGFGDFFFGASIVAVGVALMVDGARRVVTDQRVLQMASNVKDGVIHLTELTTEVVARNMEELKVIIDELAKHPHAEKAALGATSTATVAVGAAIGSSLAAGSVTVLGSHGLGATALSLGLVSAPVWPIVAGGAAGLAIGVAAWKGVMHYRNKKGGDGEDEPSHGGFLPGPDNN